MLLSHRHTGNPNRQLSVPAQPERPARTLHRLRVGREASAWVCTWHLLGELHFYLLSDLLPLLIGPPGEDVPIL